MLSIPPLQCFFCSHINPAGSVFCNDCGKQLTLKPCARCGAVNDRAARNCHECGVELVPPAVPGADGPPAPAEPSPVQQPASPEEAASPMLWGKRPNGEAVNGHVFSAAGVIPNRPLRWWIFVPVVVLLAAIASFAYVNFESGSSGEFGWQSAGKRSISGIPRLPEPEEATPPADAMPPDKAPNTALVGDAPSSAALPSTATAPADTARAVPVSPVLKECPQAVAALGLCGPDNKQEP